jgi:hypothetical protein
VSHGIIYKATGPGGKVYIGQTVKTLAKRKAGHKFMSLKMDVRTAFQISLLDEGFDNFTWEQIDQADTAEELDQKEQAWIAHYDSTNPDKGYNLSPGGISWIPSEETRRKIGEAQEGEKNHMFGKHHAEETGQKMSESRKGKPNGREGKRPTEETRQKMSEAQRGLHAGENHHFFGRHLSEEHRRKLSEAGKGRPVSEETRRKIGEALKGKASHVMTEETRRKISEAGKGHPTSEETRRKISEANRGRHHTEESRRHMSEARKKYLAEKKAMEAANV